MAASKVIFVGFLVVMGMNTVSEGALSKRMISKMSRINKGGPFLGVVVSNSYEMNPY